MLEKIKVYSDSLNSYNEVFNLYMKIKGEPLAPFEIIRLISDSLHLLN